MLRSIPCCDYQYTDPITRVTPLFIRSAPQAHNQLKMHFAESALMARWPAGPIPRSPITSGALYFPCSMLTGCTCSTSGITVNDAPLMSI